MDNPKKKKLDAKRIALKQKHEMDYMRKRSKELIELCDYAFSEDKNPIVFIGNDYFSVRTLKRMAKCILMKH